MYRYTVQLADSPAWRQPSGHAPLDRSRVGERAEAKHRAVGQLDAVDHVRGVEDEDVVAGLAAGFELGDLEVRASDRLAVVAPGRRRVVDGVAAADDLELEPESGGPRSSGDARQRLR